MDWLIGLVFALVGLWTAYVFYRRKRREAKGLDKRLKEEVYTNHRRHPSAFTERDVPRQRIN